MIYAATPVGIALVSRWVLHEHNTPLQRAGTGVALVGVVYVLAKGSLANLMALPFTLIEAAVMPAPPFGAQALLLVALAGLLPGFLSYQAYAVLPRELSATRAGLVMYLFPLYAAGMA